MCVRVSFRCLYLARGWSGNASQSIVYGSLILYILTVFTAHFLIFACAHTHTHWILSAHIFKNTTTSQSTTLLSQQILLFFFRFFRHSSLDSLTQKFGGEFMGLHAVLLLLYLYTIYREKKLINGDADDDDDDCAPLL